MPVSLRIFMVDLMAFAFNGSDLWALLPDGRQGDPLHNIPKHWPVLVFKDGSGNPGDWTQIVNLLGLNTPQLGDTAWLLHQEDISIRFSGTPAPNTAAMGSIVGSQLPNAANHASFAWVPGMSDVSPANAVLADGMFGSSLPSGVVARMELPPGTVPETFAFSKFGNGAGGFDIFPFTFTPGNTFLRALADVVVARYQVNGPITISSTNLGRTTTFTPAKDTDILLANLSPMPSGPNADPHGYHFRMYYGLCKNATPGPIPLLQANQGSEAPGGIEDQEPPIIEEVSEAPIVGSYGRPICTFVQF
jgi:hypothetical protein